MLTTKEIIQLRKNMFDKEEFDEQKWYSVDEVMQLLKEAEECYKKGLTFHLGQKE